VPPCPMLMPTSARRDNLVLVDDALSQVLSYQSMVMSHAVHDETAMIYRSAHTYELSVKDTELR